jgi:WhiB family redox-sensing transcriptional regulator
MFVLSDGRSSGMTWRTSAACLGADPDLFFANKGENWKSWTAKAICRSCPVKAECLSYACELRLMYGIFGGLTYTQRRRTWVEAA